ncbi:MAG: DTW domain-containing protein, partial [Bdellovibrionota bacterium]
MTETEVSCKKCEKRSALCICDFVSPTKTSLQILILQHPQERQEDLDTARLAQLTLDGSILRTGLSWPNLKSVLKKEAQPSRWAVLYLGSGIKSETPAKPATGVHFIDKKAKPTTRPESLDGIVILDGTWSQ